MNRTTTYCAFLYGDVTYQSRSGEIKVGFSSEILDKSYFLPRYFIDGIIPIDSTSNVDIPGLWSFRIDSESILLPGKYEDSNNNYDRLYDCTLLFPCFTIKSVISFYHSAIDHSKRYLRDIVVPSGNGLFDGECLYMVCSFAIHDVLLQTLSYVHVHVLGISI